MIIYILLRDQTFKEVDIGRLGNEKLYDRIYYLQNKTHKRKQNIIYLENPTKKKRMLKLARDRMAYARTDIGNLGRSYFEDRYNGFPW